MNSFFNKQEVLQVYSYFRKPLVILLLLLSSLVLGYMLYQDWDQISAWNWQIDWIYLLISFIIFSVNLFIAAFAWAKILNTLGEHVEFARHVSNFVISNAAKRIPGAVWTWVSRFFFYRPYGLSLGQTSSAGVLELFAMAVAGGIVSAIFGGFTLLDDSYSYVMWILAIMGLILVNPRIVRLALRKLRVTDTISIGYLDVLSWILLYILIWVLGGITLFMIARGVTPISWAQLPHTIAAWSIAGIVSIALIFLPTKLGIMELSLSILLSNIIPISLSVIVAILTRGLLTIFEILWATIFWLRRSQT